MTTDAPSQPERRLPRALIEDRAHGYLVDLVAVHVPGGGLDDWTNEPSPARDEFEALIRKAVFVISRTDAEEDISEIVDKVHDAIYTTLCDAIDVSNLGFPKETA